MVGWGQIVAIARCRADHARPLPEQNSMQHDHQTQAFIAIQPRANHGVDFPERYLQITKGAVRQGQRSLISVSDAGHHPFALLVAVDALVAAFGQAALDEEGIAVPGTFFRRHKDDSGWHRDEVLAALAELHLRLDQGRGSEAEPRETDLSQGSPFDLKSSYGTL
jgi:hypothetical protein